MPEYQDYITVIERHLAERAEKDNRPVFIFVASDEAEFISYLSEQFENVGLFETIRYSSGAVDPSSEGQMGWSIPSFIKTDRMKALEGAILDYAGLCRSDFMIHNFGSLTNAVLLTRPDIGNQLIGIDYVEKSRRRVPRHSS